MAVKLIFGQQWNLNQTPLGLSAPVVFDSNSTVTLKVWQPSPQFHLSIIVFLLELSLWNRLLREFLSLLSLQQSFSRKFYKKTSKLLVAEGKVPQAESRVFGLRIPWIRGPTSISSGSRLLKNWQHGLQLSAKIWCKYVFYISLGQRLEVWK